MHLYTKLAFFLALLGYMSDLLVLNSDINERNNRNSSLNLVCPGFKRETEGGGGGRGDVHLVWGHQYCGMHYQIL